MQNVHFRTTRPEPIESVNGIRRDSFCAFKKAAAEQQADAAQPNPEMARIIERLKRPIVAADLDTPDYGEPVSGLRARIGLGPEPSNLRERILGVEEPELARATGLRARIFGHGC